MRLYHFLRRALVPAVCLILGLPAMAELHRGVWFWGSTTLPGGSQSPFGSGMVVGNGAAEDETVAFLTTHGVKRIYGSYQNRPVSEPPVIAAWNTKLDAAGISSQILIDGHAVNDVVEMANILTKITNRLINFNASSGTDDASKFDALHLDLEPQGLALWDSGSPAVKRALLGDLLTAYTDIRAHLDGAGLTAMPMYADIPFFWDKLPGDGGSVGWTDAADRDAWFGAIAAELSGISIMTFSKGNFTDIDAAIDYERTGAFSGRARLGIQPKVGHGQLWPTILHFGSVMNQCEAAYGPTGATDLENYAFWRHAIETTQPGVADPISLTIAGFGSTTGVPAGGKPVVIFDGLPGYIYIVRQGSDPDRVMQEIARVRTTTPADAETIAVPVTPQGPRQFWMVERRPEQR